ncbi:hypothetical protein GF325_03870 [Candidatus Bathyarchaeota archaeon]|nr:hypothetical protein [Candidatus Bathyarchaeota archaeon]
MNKLGLLAGIISVPFLAVLHLPMGNSLLPLHFFEDGVINIGIYGRELPGLGDELVKVWWFLDGELKVILTGIIMWVFPLIAVILCFVGVAKPPDVGNKIYSGAFFLSFIGILLLVIDALFLGQVIVSKTYTFAEFFSGISVGFWIYSFNLGIMVLAARTYEEV